MAHRLPVGAEPAGLGCGLRGELRDRAHVLRLIGMVDHARDRGLGPVAEIGKRLFMQRPAAQRRQRLLDGLPGDLMAEHEEVAPRATTCGHQKPASRAGFKRGAGIAAADRLDQFRRKGIGRGGGGPERLPVGLVKDIGPRQHGIADGCRQMVAAEWRQAIAAGAIHELADEIGIAAGGAEDRLAIETFPVRKLQHGGFRQRRDSDAQPMGGRNIGEQPPEPRLARRIVIPRALRPAAGRCGGCGGRYSG